MVAQYLSTVWPHASVGRGQGKDIQNVPFDIEVKVLAQLKARTSISGEIGVAVLRLNGQGEDAGEYACILRLEDLLALLELKYGHIKIEPKETDIIRCNCGSWMIGECKTCQPAILNAKDVES